MKPGDTVARRFRIERRASSGGMGTVYRAIDLLSRAPVALKVLRSDDPDDAARFQQEATLLADLHHPGIVKHIAHGVTSEGEPFIAMEWLEGSSLGALLAAGPLPPDRSLEVVRHAARALAAAHEAGVVHRDINPSNLFLPGGSIERLVLIDFGVARSPWPRRLVTLAGTLVGTPGYMSPEQARGDVDVDARADVFALGCVLFECLTGKPPFVGDHVVAVLAKTLLEDPPPVSDIIPGVPRAASALCARMLAKEPADRFDDAAGVLDALDALTAKDSSAEGSTAAGGGRKSGRPALTSSEQKVLCVLLTGNLEIGVSTWSPSDSEALDEARSVAEALGGKAERLAGGALLVTLTGSLTPKDLAARAARCAVLLRETLPEHPMVIETGRGMLASRIPVGEVIDRAVSALSAARPGPIRLDDATAGLIDGRFDVGRDEAGLFLVRELESTDAARPLLGRPTPFVGRNRELGALEDMLDECVAEPIARAMLVTGPAGIGKSRLLHELCRAVLRRRGESGVCLLFARGDSLSAGSPFGMLASVMQRAAGITGGEPAAERHAKLRARVSRRLQGSDAARVSELLGELARAPLPEEGSPALSAARRDPVLMGDQMRAAWEDWLLAECSDRPILLILEDLQWGDLPTVSFVSAALRALRERPLFVIALARPDVKDRFPGLWADRDVAEMRLGALPRRACMRLVHKVLGAGVSLETAAQVVERSEGNPFFLEELLRAVAEGSGTALPETVLAMVQARLDALDPEVRRALRAASVFGQRFFWGGVLSLLGGGEERGKEDRAAGDHDGGVELLRALEEREIITRPEGAVLPGEAQLAFRHSVMREAAYAMLTDADKRLGHKLAGAWLEEAGESDPMVLAEHFDRGDESLRAARWYRRAAEQALEGNDFEAALARSERGTSLLATASGEAVGALRLVQAMAHRWRGELSLALERSEAAALAFERGSASWFSSIAEAIGASVSLARFDDVERWAAEAGAAEPSPSVGIAAPSSGPLPAPSSGPLPAPARASRPPRASGPPPMPPSGPASSPASAPANDAKVLCLSRAAGGLIAAGRRARAAPFVAQIEELARGGTLGLRALAWVQRMRATSAVHEGDMGAYLAALGASCEAFEQAGDVRNACSQRNNLGFALAELGDFARAELELRGALAAAERMGLPAAAAGARHNLGYVLAQVGSDAGRLAEARALEEQAIEAFEAYGSPRMAGASRMYLATIACAAGDLDRAESDARAAVDLLSTVPPLHPHALATLSRVLLARGRPNDALAFACSAVAGLVSGDRPESGEARVRLVLAEALAACGLSDEAARAIAEARDILLARAEMIADPDLRGRFLSAVPDNARALALAREWADRSLSGAR